MNLRLSNLRNKEKKESLSLKVKMKAKKVEKLTAQDLNGALNLNIMKKLILLGLTMLIISCSSESILDSEVDLTPLSKSKLKFLIENSTDIKNEMEERINDQLVSLVHRDIDTPTPGGEDGICPMAMIEKKAVLTHSNSIVSSIGIFNDDSRVFRDNVLLSGETGAIYKDVYYYLGSYLNNDEISISDVQNFISIMPTVKNIYERINDSSYSGVVISNNEKENILSFINSIESKIQDNNSSNIQLIEAIKEDVASLTNRNSNQILEFITQ